MSQALFRWLALSIAIGLLAACAGTPERGPAFSGAWLVDGALQPEADTTAPKPNAAPPGLAVVLGGGGLRGYAHIGVLQALDEAGLRPDLVVGTSIGAIVGAAYAAGASPDELWRQASALQVSALADVTLQGPGFVKGEALARWAGQLVGQQALERFPLRFAAVATDVDRGLPYVITQGDTGQALRASAAIPGVFLPVRSGGAIFVDGGVTSLVPVLAARALGAELVIAVDIYCHGPQYPSNTVMSMWLRVSQVQSCLLSRQEAGSADVLIAPAVAPAGIRDAEGRETARRRGYEAASAVLPAIRAAMQRQGFPDERGNSIASTAAKPSLHP
ncbi:patatin-like phospholipase family protein [Roseateles chitosanitabidus]|uniref:patatin-like phospholipase family protein n=1 Tax=Roseateles chitosanitabidus TaxID=65048 RepID=UPI000A04AA36|nr:patatin-like phospholipase family protein [Roseateles chitosanitabidus]MBO9687199.1 patatin-like phospholipase family protein [Roseateles chitosanitabidus]